MNKVVVGATSLGLAAVIGGVALWTTLGQETNCGGNAVAGGNIAIGGPFELLNGAGELVTDEDVIDGPTLVYFGYTFCPDVCPFDVARNVIAVDILAEQGLEVTPVFISIDPERDTPDVVAQYAEDLHPNMIDLTGTPEQLRAASQAYKTYYARSSGEGDFYLMDHSTFTYLMFPETGLATYFGRDVQPEEMARQTACLAADR